MWRNNGNSTFTDVSEASGLGVEATGAGVAVTDFNNDRAIDFILAGGANGAGVYLNPREGKFIPLPAIDFPKEKTSSGSWGDAFLIFLIKMDSWTWLSPTQERRESACGAM